ncbi:hypothetical protein E2C01_085902 [Portunus trituberculatus]|uniref:Uncharacterized protein n=1 Tax=Portunus trituberculatus TaxID=210409 RepID=A0A5B7JD68_PORTR|nr:hypothetical protein [Portunus trituberculatus]
MCNLTKSMAYNLHLYNEFAKVFKQEFLDFDYNLNKSISAAANACVTREINTCIPVCVELNYADASEASAMRPEMLSEAYKEFQLDEKFVFSCNR